VADIPVKPRRTGTPWWLWLVLVLVLAGLVWFALEFLRDDDAAEPDDTEAVEVGAVLPEAAPAPLALPLAVPPPSLPR
jgi:hypothetical protein